MKLKIASAAVSLFLENCVAAFSWLFAWCAGFISLWLTGYSSQETTIIFWLGVIGLYIWGLSRFVVPIREDIFRRAEAASFLRHRPLRGLKDLPVTDGHPELWELEKTRQKNLLARLRYSQT